MGCLLFSLVFLFVFYFRQRSSLPRHFLVKEVQQWPTLTYPKLHQIPQEWTNSLLIRWENKRGWDPWINCFHTAIYRQIVSQLPCYVLKVIFAILFCTPMSFIKRKLLPFNAVSWRFVKKKKSVWTLNKNHTYTHSTTKTSLRQTVNVNFCNVFLIYFLFLWSYVYVMACYSVSTLSVLVEYHIKKLIF